MNMAVNKLFLLLCCELFLVESQTSIPRELRECYADNTTLNAPLPLLLRIVVDIIRKVEANTYTTMDMRMLSSSLLRRLRFDGIEYQLDVQPADGVLPFSGTGLRRVKHRLIEELIPGNPKAFPLDMLSSAERCVLHHAISNTVMMHKSLNANKTCEKDSKSKNTTGGTTLNGIWDCPRQDGVVLTPYGSVSLGAFIGAVAASLQHQRVSLSELATAPEKSTTAKTTASTQDLDYNEEEIEFVLPKSEMIHQQSMWYQSLITSPVTLDNVWLTTVAGELAEMAVYNGPLGTSNMTLGATGYWNNIFYPSIYYFVSSYKSLYATSTELIGGIDGLIIASKLENWFEEFYSLRLSQVLDMYYSSRGINFKDNVRACDRERNFWHAVPKTILFEQTYVIAKMLAYRRSIANISPEGLQRLVNETVNIFYAKRKLFTDLPCYPQQYPPRVEALLVFDGKWSTEYTKDFLTQIIQDIDVSMYGSKIGIIHSTSGRWLLNITDSPSTAFQSINALSDTPWPTNVNFPQILNTVFSYLNETWKYNHKKPVIGNLGQVVILLLPSSYMSDSEKDYAKTLLQQIKQHHPDVYFLYYVSQYNMKSFESFILSTEDYLIQNSSLRAINQHLATVPRTLRPVVLPKLNVNYKFPPQVEDYITPSESITYRLHPHWRRGVKNILVTFHAFNYGTMTICSWSQFHGNITKEHCAELKGSEEIVMTDHYQCTDNLACPDTYYRIQNVTSLYKCTEMECKTIDQVRFIIRTTNVYIESSSNQNNISVSLSFLFLYITFFL